MRILIAEDERITRRSLQRQLERWGHDVFAAEDGAEAWGRFQTQQFDIVVTDWDMPRIDGRELIERIRGAERSHYAYLIMLTGHSEAADLVAGMEAGADDFLAKPFDPNELRVRLRAGERVIQLERRLAAQNQTLQAANDRMTRDLDAAARVQQTLLPGEVPDAEGLSFAWAYRPCDELAGDALNVVRINDRLIGLYVLDVSGHGVPAALLSVTATRSLSPHAGLSLVTGPGPDSDAISPARVASKLNALYPMESNGSHYFTLMYGLLDVQTRELRYTCAGHPGPILVRPGQSQRRFGMSALPIGMIEGVEYEEARIALRPGDRLYVHSDGVTEEMNPADEEFGDERLYTAIAEGQSLPLAESMDLIIQRIVAWRGDEHLKDDVSILCVEIA